MSRKDDKLMEQLSDYLKDNLSPQERADFEARLATASNKEEVEGLRDMWLKLQSLPEAEPDATMHPRFYAMLEAYKAGQQHAAAKAGLRDVINRWLERWWPRQPVMQFGLALALLVAGLFVGNRLGAGNGDLSTLRREVGDLRQMVAISLLQSQSSSDRLRGVTYSNRIERPDESTLSALMNTLNYDPNLNVRLATVDALSAFYDREIIRQGLLESLNRQSSPMMQIALIELLVAQEEKRSIEILEQFINSEKLDQAVRQRASKAIEQLQQ